MSNKPLPYSLSYREVLDGYVYVHGRPHGFKRGGWYEVTHRFATREERKSFIRQVNSLENKTPVDQPIK
jgi:hypothetical protein